MRENSQKTIIFIVVLSFVCALILSVLASALAKPKEIAKDLDRSKQMLIAAKVLSPQGYFIIEEKGKTIPAQYEQGRLIPSEKPVFAEKEDILKVYNERFIPRLVNDKGEIKTFEEAKLTQDTYLSDYRKTGYYKQPWKLIYEILPNPGKESGKKEEKPIGYIIPINGYGLWDAIYGYLAIKPDADTVIGISWYDQKETPGLGAVIAEEGWQNQFPGKKIFQENASGQTDFKTAPLGITVVKGKVSEVLGNSPKAKSAVDGITGATLTGNGVNDAFKNVLSAYRPFLIKMHNENKDQKA